mgnify:CR=1 FL=1
MAGQYRLGGQAIVPGLIAAAIAIGSTVRGGHVEPEPGVGSGAQPGARHAQASAPQALPS